MKLGRLKNLNQKIPRQTIYLRISSQYSSALLGFSLKIYENPLFMATCFEKFYGKFISDLRVHICDFEENEKAFSDIHT